MHFKSNFLSLCLGDDEYAVKTNIRRLLYVNLLHVTVVVDGMLRQELHFHRILCRVLEVSLKVINSVHSLIFSGHNLSRVNINTSSPNAYFNRLQVLWY